MGSAYRLLTVALLALVTIIAFEAMAISTAMPASPRTWTRFARTGSPSR
jgi:hypothetical protein